MIAILYIFTVCFSRKKRVLLGRAILSPVLCFFWSTEHGIFGTTRWLYAN